MEADETNRLRSIEIEILDYVTKICDENNLRYYLIYGTLLGAVRHKGFIPWDDDIDICLLRKDYEKLCAILREQCKRSSTFYFQEPCDDEDFKLPFVKVRKRGTVFLEDQELDTHKEQGIFVDIFPLDKVPKKYGLQKLYSKLIYVLLAHAKSKNSNFYRIAHTLSCLYENRNCKYLVSYGSAYPVERDVLDAEWFNGTELFPFEGKKYSVPSGYKQYLEALYGADYMQLPPPELRVNHNVRLLLFNKEKELTKQ